ncbi:unnamed protein product [Prunus armeniaca]
MEEYGPDSDDMLAVQKESSTKPPSKRKADCKSSKDKAATTRARDVSPLTKKPKLAYAVIKFSSKEVSSAGKTQVGAAPSSFARVKHLISVDSKKVRHAESSGHYAQVSHSLAQRLQSALQSPFSSRSSRLHQSKDEDRIGRTALLPNHCDSPVEPRAIKHGDDSASLTPLEVRMAAAKKVRESFTRAKGSSQM